ncbi:hypothetical protein V4841_13410 [Lelliottia amnigena]|uniref:Lipoprotein n=1 Tax=Lelliottia amnigena TaxID=61646 RepID=A0ABU7UEX0_LELAM
MKKRLIALMSLAAIIVAPAHAIDAKYRAKLERSGCTQLTEADGSCDTNKTKSQNQAVHPQNQVDVTPYIGTWQMFDANGQRLLKLVVRKKDYMFDGKPIETTNAPFITDKGELYLVFRTRSIALKSDDTGEWHSPTDQGYLTRQ